MFTLIIFRRTNVHLFIQLLFARVCPTAGPPALKAVNRKEEWSKCKLRTGAISSSYKSRTRSLRMRASGINRSLFIRQPLPQATPIYPISFVITYSDNYQTHQNARPHPLLHPHPHPPHLPHRHLRRSSHRTRHRSPPSRALQPRLRALLMWRMSLLPRLHWLPRDMDCAMVRPSHPVAGSGGLYGRTMLMEAVI